MRDNISLFLSVTFISLAILVGVMLISGCDIKPSTTSSGGSTTINFPAGTDYPTSTTLASSNE